MIGKGRRNRGLDYAVVSLDLLCDRGHKVGMAWLDVPPSPYAGDTHARRVTWVDSAAGGMVTATCQRCGARPQWRWARVLDRLAEMETRGEPTGAMKP